MLLFNNLEEIIGFKSKGYDSRDWQCRLVCVLSFPQPPIQDQSYNRVKTSQLTFKANQLTSSYMMGTLIFNGSSS